MVLVYILVRVVAVCMLGCGCVYAGLWLCVCWAVAADMLWLCVCSAMAVASTMLWYVMKAVSRLGWCMCRWLMNSGCNVC